MNDLVTKTETLPANQASATIQAIERICLNPEMDVEKLERMLDMQERILDRQAEQAFQVALADMQSKLPVIQKNGEISIRGVVQSRFAKFEDINRAVMPIMQEHGFSLTFETQQATGYVNVIGVLRHRDGHKESTQLQIPLDTSGSKNAVQAVGSSVSYGKRYVMSALLNLTTTDDDDDGVSAVPSIDLLAHNMAVQSNFDSIAAIKTEIANEQFKTAFLLWSSDISDADKHALWVAPTKGGIFTTKEREALQKGKSMGNKEEES